MKSKMKKSVSVIVPVYNNQKTIKKVIDVLLSCNFFEKIIVVDDASQDLSLKILKSFKHRKLQLLLLPFNHGKGAAIEKALSLVKAPIIMIVDADLSKLKKEHLINLKNSFINSDADMIIAARKGKLNFNPIDCLSGERIFFKKNIKPVRSLLKKVNNGFEQVVNFAHRNKKVELIYSYNIGHVLKLHRYKNGEIHKILISYTEEGWDLFKTELLLKTYWVKTSIPYNYISKKVFKEYFGKVIKIAQEIGKREGLLPEDYKTIAKIAKAVNFKELKSKVKEIKNKKVKRYFNKYIIKYVKLAKKKIKNFTF